MEQTVWSRFVQFVKNCYQEKFTIAFKGCCFGLFGSLGIFWNGALAASVVIYLLKGIGTVLLTAATTLTTCYVSYKFDKWKNNDKPKRQKKDAAKKRTA